MLDIERYIDECSFNEKQKALFLLGVVIREIDDEYILKRVFHYLEDRERLAILYNLVFEKLKALRLYDKEEIYIASKMLFDKNYKNWDLKSYENTYYIISGYCFKRR